MKTFYRLFAAISVSTALLVACEKTQDLTPAVRKFTEMGVLSNNLTLCPTLPVLIGAGQIKPTYDYAKK